MRKEDMCNQLNYHWILISNHNSFRLLYTNFVSKFVKNSSYIIVEGLKRISNELSVQISRVSEMQD